ncbi:MAG: hypothetical protein OXN21_12975 [Chloroflexota bacterium]|nr:hypothetical protein [Chloroflexota bacterium]
MMEKTMGGFCRDLLDDDPYGQQGLTLKGWPPVSWTTSGCRPALPWKS